MKHVEHSEDKMETIRLQIDKKNFIVLLATYNNDNTIIRLLSIVNKESDIVTIFKSQFALPSVRFGEISSLTFFH